MITSIGDGLEQTSASRLRLSGTRAKNGGEFLLVANHRFPCQLQFLVACIAESPANLVVHQDRVWQANAHVSALDEPQGATLCADHDECEVHLEELSEHQHAVVAFATVINTTSIAVEDDGDTGSRMLCGEIFQNCDFGLTSRHGAGPVEDVFSIDQCDRFRVVRARLGLVLFGVTFHGFGCGRKIVILPMRAAGLPPLTGTTLPRRTLTQAEARAMPLLETAPDSGFHRQTLLKSSADDEKFARLESGDWFGLLGVTEEEILIPLKLRYSCQGDQVQNMYNFPELTGPF